MFGALYPLDIVTARQNCPLSDFIAKSDGSRASEMQNQLILDIKQNVPCRKVCCEELFSIDDRK